MQAYLPLLEASCSPDVRFLLCSAYVPLCSEHVTGAVGGCRALCERVAAPCRARLVALALPPALLDCARYPDHAARQLCMQLPNASEPQPPGTAWTEGDDADEHDDRPCPPAFARAADGTCAPQCEQDAHYRPEEKRFASAWHHGWAWISFLSTVFALLTFCADPSRFRYPERPVVFLAACHAVRAFVQLGRVWIGAHAVSCASGALAADALPSAPCTLFFLATYYFTLAADAWFLNLCVAWYLSAASEWSAEALERASGYFHAAAWGWAGAWSAVALAMRRVAADELTGACLVTDGATVALVGVPRGAPLGAAVVLGLGAGLALRRVRRALAGRGASRLARLTARLAILATLYWAAAAGGAAISLYEAHARPRWRALTLLAAPECAGATDCPPGGSRLLEVALARAWLQQLAGVAAGLWAWSGKSCRTWARACGAPRKASCCRGAPACYAKHPLNSMYVSRV